MKLGPVTKLDRRNKTRSRKVNDDVMPENCDVIVIFQIFDQFGAVQFGQFGGGRIQGTESAEVMSSVTVTFCLTKLKTELKNI